MLTHGNNIIFIFLPMLITLSLTFNFLYINHNFFFYINIFFWDKCGKFLTYEFCSISALDTLNWMYPYFPTYRAKLFRNPLPFCLSLAANYSTLSLSLSLSLSLFTNRHPPSMFGDSEHVSSNLSFCLFLFFQFLIGFEHLHTHLLGLAWKSMKHWF